MPEIKVQQDFKSRLHKWIKDLVFFLDALPNDFISKNLTSQLFRSGSSIGANFNEAYAASSKKDFINFFHHALKSANESKFWLELIKDIRKVDESKIGALTEELDSICRILAKSIITAKNRK